MKNIHIPIDPALLAQYTSISQFIGNNEVSMCMDLKHIINCSYKLVLDSSNTFYTIDFKSGHFAGTLRKLEQEGFVHIKSHIKFGNGCIEYQAEDLFSGRSFTHTEFPPHWTIEKIAEEIKSTYQQFMEQGKYNIDLKKPIRALHNEGFNLKIIVTANPVKHTCPSFLKTENIHIVTAHPIFEGKL